MVWYVTYVLLVTAECPPGFTSTTGLSPCQLVPADYYWVDANTTMKCPSGTKNPQEGGKNAEACKGNTHLMFQVINNDVEDSIIIKK